MIYSKKIQEAINFSITTHELDQKQKRKGKDIPYITHPLTVGLILARAGASEDVIAAGILHDTIEDHIAPRTVDVQALAERFGDNVAMLVYSVTEKYKAIPWEDRKRAALNQVATYSHDSLLLKSADLLSNTTELIDDVENDGDKVFSRFNAPKEKSLEHYVKVIKAILERWHENPLAADLECVLIQLKKMQQNVPFAAFTMNDGEGTFEVCLVNPTSTTYSRTVLFTGAFEGDEDGLLETSKVVKEKGTLPAHTSVVLDKSDYGELDFVIWYHLDLYTNPDETPTMVWFELPKGGGSYSTKAKLLPEIGRIGLRLDLLDRMDKTTIKEEVKITNMKSKYTKSTPQSESVLTVNAKGDDEEKQPTDKGESEVVFLPTWKEKD